MIGIFETARGVVRGCGGLWRYLTERVHARKAVELERARNEATAAVLPLLPPGTDFYESEPGGRTRLIRMAPASLPQAGPDTSHSTEQITP